MLWWDHTLSTFGLTRTFLHSLSQPILRTTRRNIIWVPYLLFFLKPNTFQRFFFLGTWAHCARRQNRQMGVGDKILTVLDPPDNNLKHLETETQSCDV